MLSRYAKVFIVIVTLVAAGFLTWTLMSRNEGGVKPMVMTYGEADIGGPFELVDTSGQAFTEKDLLGRYALVYFGFTNCPDVCPLDMNRISMALDVLEKGFDFSARLQPVFISVDAVRDNPETVAAFLEQYHPSFVGLSGNPEQIDRAAKAYKVYFEHILARQHGDAGMISHSAYIYLMGPDGKFIDMYDSGVTYSALADALADRLY